MYSDISENKIKPKKFYNVLYIQVLFAIVVGVALGYFYPSLSDKMKILGELFILLIKMIIAPVIFTTVVLGIANLKDLKKVGNLTAKAMLYFVFFSTMALALGMFIANVVKPGQGMHVSPTTLSTSEISKYVNASKEQNIMHFVFDIIPITIISPLTGSNILQVLFVAIIFGVALVLTADKSKMVLDFMQALSYPIFKVVAIIMKFAPIGAMGAMAFTIGKYGIASITNLAFLIVCFYATSLLFIIVILGLVARYCRFSVFKLLRYIKEELLLVLGTSSSEAALPNLMEKMEKAGCSKSVVGLTVPLGYSFNLDGTNIYITLAALFIAQACDIHLSFSHQILLFFFSILSSKGAAGVTGAGFVTLATTLTAVPDIPIAGITLILGVDRFMSECRSLTNFVGNAVATIVVAKWNKELNVTQLNDTLNKKVSA